MNKLNIILCLIGAYFTINGCINHEILFNLEFLYGNILLIAALFLDTVEDLSKRINKLEVKE